MVQWNKPVLVLHDELSGSGGDALPMILQHGGMKTFGARPAGMGGSVSGVMNYPYDVTVYDFRGGFVSYALAFTQVATTLRAVESQPAAR